MNLAESAADFNRFFKTEKVNVYFIYKIYKELGVKRKMGDIP